MEFWKVNSYLANHECLHLRAIETLAMHREIIRFYMRERKMIREKNDFLFVRNLFNVDIKE